jgi:LacI family transcriptional regulator
VIGFDDIPAASWPEINLTTIKQPKIQMGAEAVDVLVALLEDEKTEITSVPRRIILDPELILRGTC